MDENLESVKDLVEITFPEKDDFLKIRETLSRIGVASRKEKELFQFRIQQHYICSVKIS